MLLAGLIYAAITNTVMLYHLENHQYWASTPYWSILVPIPIMRGPRIEPTLQFHENHCNTQLWTQTAHLLQFLCRFGLLLPCPYEGW